MSRYPMTPVVAERTYDFLGNQGEKETITIQVGRPAPTTDTPHPAWYCPWSVTRKGKTRILSAVGEDSLQALLLALSGVRTDLELIAQAGKLSHHGIDGPFIELVG